MKVTYSLIMAVCAEVLGDFWWSFELGMEKPFGFGCD